MAKKREDSEREEVDAPGEFPVEHRKIITQPVDLSIATLVDQWKDDLLVLPDIQRDYVWDNAKASKLIESLLLNIPIPVLYFAENEDANYEVIDGHQRLKSIVRYLGDEFPLSRIVVLNELRGCRFSGLSQREQRLLRMRTMRAIIIAVESHPSMKFEVFERLNTGSISLNAQELRNSVYRGAFNELLRELAREPSFRTAMASKAPRKRMIDEELILRFLALSRELEVYKPSLKRFLNAFMLKNRAAAPEQICEFRKNFVGTIERVVSALGATAFRLTDANGALLEKAVNRALFDAQMLAFSWVEGDVRDRREAIVSALGKLYEDATFLDSIRRATGDRSRMFTRVRGVVETLRASGLTVKMPGSLDVDQG